MCFGVFGDRCWHDSVYNPRAMQVESRAHQCGVRNTELLSQCRLHGNCLQNRLEDEHVELASCGAAKIEISVAPEQDHAGMYFR